MALTEGIAATPTTKYDNVIFWQFVGTAGAQKWKLLLLND
jgi:hypothetical protein